MAATKGEVMFELVKRDGRHEKYDPTKLARSLTRAGVAPYMLAGILDSVAPNPDEDTGSLRADVESELECWQPTAARRYAQTRRVYAFGSEVVVRGSVVLDPEALVRLGVKPGDFVWLGENGTWVPFTVETMAQTRPGQVWLNSADLAGMDVNPGARLLATGAHPEPLRHGVSRAPVRRHDAMVLASVR
jgi:hypothetical protein